MIEFNLETSAGSSSPASIAVSVVGVGGAGANVLDRIALEGMPGAELICMTSDVRILNHSMAARKLQLGPEMTQGLGAGGDPELGMEAAQASEGEIRDLFRESSMVFLCAGLGGGTGSGAAPYLAKLAREAGAFVVVFATLPFSFEGRRRQKQAFAALEELRRHANALVTFDNDRMGELILPKKGIQEAFQLADKIIGQSIRAVTSLVTQPGLIRIGMDDLITALRNTDSRCLFGFGQAKGENRSLEALHSALKSPLLDRGQMLSKAHNVLVHVCGGPSMTLFEIETLMRELQKHVHEDAHLLFGAASDPKLGDHISVTVLSSLGKETAAAPGKPSVEAVAAPLAAPAAAPAPAPATTAARPPAAPAAEETPTVKLQSPPVEQPRPAAPPVREVREPAQREIPAPPSRATAPEADLEDKPVLVIGRGGTTSHRPPVAAPAASLTPAKAPVPMEPEAEEEVEEFEDLEELKPSAVSRPVSHATASTAVRPRPEPEPEAEMEEEEYEDEEEDTGEVLAEEDAEQEEYEEEAYAQEEEEEYEEEPPAPAPVAAAPPPAQAPAAKKFAIRDILMRPKSETAPAPQPSQGNGRHAPSHPQQQRPAPAPAPAPARPAPASIPAAKQQTFDERLQPGARGRFEKASPSVEQGEDLDIPTFLRKKR
jgi:cell division protein FtsZ